MSRPPSPSRRSQPQMVSLIHGPMAPQSHGESSHSRTEQTADNSQLLSPFLEMHITDEWQLRGHHYAPVKRRGLVNHLPIMRDASTGALQQYKQAMQEEQKQKHRVQNMCLKSEAKKTVEHSRSGVHQMELQTQHQHGQQREPTQSEQPWDEYYQQYCQQQLHRLRQHQHQQEQKRQQHQKQQQQHQKQQQQQQQLRHEQTQHQKNPQQQNREQQQQQKQKAQHCLPPDHLLGDVHPSVAWTDHPNTPVQGATSKREFDIEEHVHVPVDGSVREAHGSVMNIFILREGANQHETSYCKEPVDLSMRNSQS